MVQALSFASRSNGSRKCGSEWLGNNFGCPKPRGDGRVAEGARLLSEYAFCSASRVRIPLSPLPAPIAQLDRATAYEAVGWRFEPSSVYLRGSS
jgi:hypothetical protein